MKTTVNHFIFSATFLSSLLFASFSGSPAYSIGAHEDIRGPFASLADVTKVCVGCHLEQAREVLQSIHWTWERKRSVNGEDILYGKKDSLTGFAIDVSSNPERCMTCHISITRPAVALNDPSPDKVDCLVCHDTTGIYDMTGMRSPAPYTSEQLILMAGNIGVPAPHNCKTCHFQDCSLPATGLSSKQHPDSSQQIQDYHLDIATPPLTCQQCHIKQSGHSFKRAVYSQNKLPGQGCASCHDSAPHTLQELNDHTATVACETCHIPQYAGNVPMIISWNWLMIGKTNRVYQHGPAGRALIQDENGIVSARRIEPIYLWDGGTEEVYTRGQRIRPQQMTYLQRPSSRGPKAKIAPFRVMYGTQMYDAKYRYLISPLLQEQEAVYFPKADWENIARKGMEAIVLPFSGQYGFAPTVRFLRLSHGIAPARDALDCVNCHGSRSRMPWKDLGYESDPWQDIDSGQDDSVSQENQ